MFAGGFPRPDGGRSPVWEAAEGRWAASSLDRWLKKVSLTAGREKDGPVESRLFTSIEGIEPFPAVTPADPKNGYDEQEAVLEAERCLQCECLECVKVCPYLERFGGYPRKYAREIYNNESIVMGSRQANKLINSCSLCGLCEAVCPEGFAMQDLCLQARKQHGPEGKDAPVGPRIRPSGHGLQPNRTLRARPSRTRDSKKAPESFFRDARFVRHLRITCGGFTITSGGCRTAASA